MHFVSYLAVAIGHRLFFVSADGRGGLILLPVLFAHKMGSHKLLCGCGASCGSLSYGRTDSIDR